MSRSAGVFVRRFRIGGAIAAGLLATLALSGPNVFAAEGEGPPGNNGTVKIHEGAGEPEPEIRNEPHVCTFHLHFFFADPEQAGSWEIQEWSPGDKGVVVLAGTYDTHGDGEDRQPEAGAYELPDGHYKLFWDGDAGKHDKMKVFWVECGGEAATTPTPTPTPTGNELPTSAPTPTPTGNELPAEGTPPPTGNELPAEGTPPPTSTPAGAVLGAEGTPAVTLPATDTDPTAADSGNGGWQGWQVALVGLGLVILAAVFAAPAPRHRRVMERPKRRH